jgi:hypothetical protein
MRTAQVLMLVMPGPQSSEAVGYFLKKDGTVSENIEGLERGGIGDPF